MYYRVRTKLLKTGYADPDPARLVPEPDDPPEIEDPLSGHADSAR